MTDLLTEQKALAALNGLLTRAPAYSALPKVALLGDSRCQLSHWFSASSNYQYNSFGSFAAYVVMQTGGRVTIPERLNFGVGGINSTDMVNRSWTYILANIAPSGTQRYAGSSPVPPATWPNLSPLESCAQSDADIVIMLVSTNDRLQSMSASSRLSLPFSSSSCRRRRASDTSNPPYLAFSL